MILPLVDLWHSKRLASRLAAVFIPARAEKNDLVEKTLLRFLSMLFGLCFSSGICTEYTWVRRLRERFASESVRFHLKIGPKNTLFPDRSMESTYIASGIEALLKELEIRVQLDFPQPLRSFISSISFFRQLKKFIATKNSNTRWQRHHLLEAIGAYDIAVT